MQRRSRNPSLWRQHSKDCINGKTSRKHLSGLRAQRPRSRLQAKLHFLLQEPDESWAGTCPDRRGTGWFYDDLALRLARETTNADAVVAIKNGIVRLIIVTREKSGRTLKTVNYVLVHDDPEYPDGPRTMFKKVSSGSLAAMVGREISNELLKQLATRY